MKTLKVTDNFIKLYNKGEVSSLLVNEELNTDKVILVSKSYSSFAKVIQQEPYNNSYKISLEISK